VTPDDIAYLYSLNNEFRSIRYDLRNMKAFAAAMGNPQDAFESILIAGTNGKGSVARMLSAMMPEAGLYTSPHLERLNERIRIGDDEIPDSALKEVFEQAKAAAASAPGLLYPPTYFEIVTAMAFTYFRERVKFAVLEVGLGGRLDATNIVHQKVSVITSIGLDHQQFLGPTLDDIAAEKAGIIKGGEPVVVGPDVDYCVVRARAGDKLVSTRDIPRSVRPLGGGYFEIDVRTPLREYKALRLRLAGRHQIDNAIVAICAAECLELDSEKIREGIQTVSWPGRLEHFGSRPEFLLDGAHNPHAARALAAFLAETHPQGVWMIFGAMADKQFEEMLGLLAPHVRQWILTRPENSRAVDPNELARLTPGGIVIENVRGAIEYAKEHVPEGTPVVVCGSLYLIGEARAVLQ
jgi:dihydrofolate synthase / folylpolyglutamate synthase